MLLFVLDDTLTAACVPLHVRLLLCWESKWSMLSSASLVAAEPIRSLTDDEPIADERPPGRAAFARFEPTRPLTRWLPRWFVKLFTRLPIRPFIRLLLRLLFRLLVRLLVRLLLRLLPSSGLRLLASSSSLFSIELPDEFCKAKFDRMLDIGSVLLLRLLFAVGAELAERFELATVRVIRQFVFAQLPFVAIGWPQQSSLSGTMKASSWAPWSWSPCTRTWVFMPRNVWPRYEQIVQRNAWLLLLDLICEFVAGFSSEVVSLVVNVCCLIDSIASSRLLVLFIAAEAVSVAAVDELFTVDTWLEAGTLAGQMCARNASSLQ